MSFTKIWFNLKENKKLLSTIETLKEQNTSASLELSRKKVTLAQIEKNMKANEEILEQKTQNLTDLEESKMRILISTESLGRENKMHEEKRIRTLTQVFWALNLYFKFDKIRKYRERVFANLDDDLKQAVEDFVWNACAKKLIKMLGMFNEKIMRENGRIDSERHDSISNSSFDFSETTRSNFSPSKMSYRSTKSSTLSLNLP